MPNFEQFNACYKAHIHQIYGYVYTRINRNKELAEDMVSEIFLKAVENFEKFDEKRGSFKSWIFQIAKNCLIDYFRSNKHGSITPIEAMEDTLKDESNTQKLAQDEIEKKIIRQAIETLAPDKKELVILRYFSGYSYEEIAAITKKSENKIRVTVHRTLRELKRKLGELKYQI